MEGLDLLAVPDPDGFLCYGSSESSSLARLEPRSHRSLRAVIGEFLRLEEHTLRGLI